MRLGRAIPNVGYEVWYRREMNRLIRRMNKDVISEIENLYNDTFAKDAPLSVAQQMKQLRAKWYKEFEKRGREAARRIATKVHNRTRKQIVDKLKETGINIQPQYTIKEKSVMAVMVLHNVKLIKSIPQKYLLSVQRIVTRAWFSGGDMQYIIDRIKKKIDKSYKNAERRAYLIAKDQMNKITQQWARYDAMAYGATAGVWIHVPGEFTSRETHIHMNGQKFDLQTGLFDPDVNKNVLPADLPFCWCQNEFIFGEE